jgi:hypothetical protein
MVGVWAASSVSQKTSGMKPSLLNNLNIMAFYNLPQKSFIAFWLTGRVQGRKV